jgi:hypothetical protein
MTTSFERGWVALVFPAILRALPARAGNSPSTIERAPRQEFVNTARRGREDGRGRGVGFVRRLEARKLNLTLRGIKE